MSEARRIDICDRAQVLATGEKIRIIGLYRLELDSDGLMVLASCSSGHPRIEVVLTAGRREEFYRVEDLDPNLEPPWTRDFIERERSCWARKVAGGQVVLSQRDHAALFARIRPRSAHERLDLIARSREPACS